eukprot:Awhi_evm1s14669
MSKAKRARIDESEDEAAEDEGESKVIVGGDRKKKVDVFSGEYEAEEEEEEEEEDHEDDDEADEEEDDSDSSDPFNFVETLNGYLFEFEENTLSIPDEVRGIYSKEMISRCSHDFFLYAFPASESSECVYVKTVRLWKPYQTICDTCTTYDLLTLEQQRHFFNELSSSLIKKLLWGFIINDFLPFEKFTKKHTTILNAQTYVGKSSSYMVVYSKKKFVHNAIRTRYVLNPLLIAIFYKFRQSGMLKDCHLDILHQLYNDREKLESSSEKKIKMDQLLFNDFSTTTDLPPAKTSATTVSINTRSKGTVSDNSTTSSTAAAAATGGEIAPSPVPSTATTMSTKATAKKPSTIAANNSKRPSSPSSKSYPSTLATKRSISPFQAKSAPATEQPKASKTSKSPATSKTSKSPASALSLSRTASLSGSVDTTSQGNSEKSKKKGAKWVNSNNK